MLAHPRRVIVVLAAALATLAGCSHAAPTDGSGSTPTTGPGNVAAVTPSTSARPSAAPSSSGATKPAAPPARAVYGNQQGAVSLPAAAQPVNTSHPTRVIGQGTPASCTSAAVVAAVAAGGVVTFNCGPNPVTITMTATAKVVNRNPKLVLDGGGLVTLSGGGKRRILYQNTCDEKQGWITSHCQDQQTPTLVVQNLSFVDGNSTGDMTEGGGGGAIFVRGGQFKVVNSQFLRNRCDTTGPDLGGAAIRVLSQYHNLPVYIVNSTFGGKAGQGGVCSNGGALSSIGVSWVVLNCIMTYNSAIGVGANPARQGTPGGGSGGAIYNDGDTFTLSIAGSIIQNNHAKEGGGAIFFVSNDRTGNLSIDRSKLTANPSDGFHTSGLPGIFFLGQHKPTITGSTLA